MNHVYVIQTYRSSEQEWVSSIKKFTSLVEAEKDYESIKNILFEVSVRLMCITCNQILFERISSTRSPILQIET